MAAATSSRPISRYGTGPVPSFKSLPMAANAVCHHGTIVCTNAAGYAVPATTALNPMAHGVAVPWAQGSGEPYDNTGGANGAKSVQVEAGPFLFENSAAGDAITIAEVGLLCYLVDNQTVAKTDGGGTRSKAGYVWGFENGKVIVHFVGHTI